MSRTRKAGRRHYRRRRGRSSRRRGRSPCRGQAGEKLPHGVMQELLCLETVERSVSLDHVRAFQFVPKEHAVLIPKVFMPHTFALDSGAKRNLITRENRVLLCSGKYTLE